MKYSSIFAGLMAIASKNPAGFTVSTNLQPVAHGYAVAVAETQNSFGLAGLKKVISYVSKNAPAINAFGGWMDRETGLFYWDATVVVETREEAEKLARINKQIAFFHLDTCEEIRL